MICLPDNIKSKELLNTIRELSWNAAKFLDHITSKLKIPKN